MGGPASDYFGPIPPNNPPPSDLTGATLCRSEAYYGTAYGSRTGRNGHLDTMSHCGIFSELSRPARRPRPTRPAAPTPFEGYPIKAGQVIRLHSEYQNGSGAPKTDVMGIMSAWLAFPDPGYPRPKSARRRCAPRWCRPTTSAARRTARTAPPLPSALLQPAGAGSGQLTVGTPDANGAAANSVGSAR